MPTILFIDNTAHHLYSQHHLYSEVAGMNYQIILCCPDDGKYFKKLQKSGNWCIALKIDGKSINPLNNLVLIWRIYKILKQAKPDLIFSFTIKPNLYTAIVGRLLKIAVVPNITGLGWVFLKVGLIHKLVLGLYRFAFANLDYAIFQNKDDSQIFLDLKLLPGNTVTVQLPGDGVNLNKFPYVGYTLHEIPCFLYIGRLLWDKGIGELIDAFRLVVKQYPAVKLKFIGDYFLANPSAITPKQMKLWQEELGIEYHGMVDNVYDFIARHDCVILPSYREGMPRAILEASSVGKVVITTDTAGCRDAVDDGITGFLCKVRDANDLADKMLKFIHLSAAGKQQMGLYGRCKMEREFDQNIVIRQYSLIVKQLTLQNKWC